VVRIVCTSIDGDAAMNVDEIWLKKTDSEVVAAFQQLDQYTTETQAVIRSEYERRSSQPHPSVSPGQSPASSNAGSRETSTREESLKAARDHLSSLPVGQSRAKGETSVPSNARQEAASSRRPASDHSEPSENGRSYEYKVIPFIGQSKKSLSASQVAQQLESVIAQQSSAGWEFCQLSDVNIEVQPGCIGGLFGASVQYVRFDQLIFRKARPT
jgi:hypothetical protein